MKDAENITALLFDFGGTLDSPSRHASRVLRDGLKHAGLYPEENIWREAYVYAERKLEAEAIIAPGDDYFVTLYKKICIEIERMKTQSDSFSDIITPQSARAAAGYCFDNALAYVKQILPSLQQLKRWYKLGLVTNFYGNISTVLGSLGLDNLFSSVTESAQVGVRKPDPVIFRIALDKTGCKAEDTIVIGDSLHNDILPSMSLGCHAVWLKGEGWTDKEETAPADCVVADSLVSFMRLLMGKYNK